MHEDTKKLLVLLCYIFSPIAIPMLITRNSFAAFFFVVVFLGAFYFIEKKIHISYIAYKLIYIVLDIITFVLSAMHNNVISAFIAIACIAITVCLKEEDL